MTTIFDRGALGFLKILMRGAGQVMFQRSAWTGLLFMVGIFWGAYASGNGAMAWGALLGLAVSTATGYILNMHSEDGRDGLWGFNGILVGCALPTLLHPTIWMWLALILCAAATTWVRQGLNNIMGQWKINSLTFPFVLCCWFFLLAAVDMDYMSAKDSIHHTHHHIVHASGFVEAILCLFRGVSQVFLIDSWITGAIFIVALGVCSCRAAIWAAVGSALGSVTAMVMGAPMSDIAQGLYGFSPTLTAIALATVFYRPSWRSAAWAVVGILFTAFVQAAMNRALAPLGIATLTAPFCITTWLFLLPLLRLDDDHPDHSSWHPSLKQHLQKK